MLAACGSFVIDIQCWLNFNSSHKTFILLLSHEGFEKYMSYCIRYIQSRSIHTFSDEARIQPFRYRQNLNHYQADEDRCLTPISMHCQPYVY